MATKSPGGLLIVEKTEKNHDKGGGSSAKLSLETSLSGCTNPEGDDLEGEKGLSGIVRHSFPERVATARAKGETL